MFQMVYLDSSVPYATAQLRYEDYRLFATKQHNASHILRRNSSDLKSVVIINHLSEHGVHLGDVSVRCPTWCKRK